MPRDERSVAIVVPGLSEGGGVPGVAMFLREVLQRAGGYQAAVISIATSSKDEASVRLLAPRSWLRGPRISAGTWRGVSFRHVGSELAEVEFFRYLPRMTLTRVLREFDLIQVVAGTPMFAFSVSSISKPKCLTVATTILQDRKSALAEARGPKKIWRTWMTEVSVLLEGFALPRMEHVFAQSEYTRELLRGRVPDDRLSIGSPGVDTSIFRPGTYRENGYILSVGRFSDPRKNVRMLFRAYHRLRRELPDAPRLLLTGSNGPTQEDLNVARELGIVNCMELRENPSVKELAELYREASLFVLSSNEEGFGIVLTEAMASGIPVVSTRSGGPESIVSDGQTGYMTPVGDHEAMASRLKELMENPPMRQSMGAAARRVAEQRFSLEATGRAYLEVYDRLLM